MGTLASQRLLIVPCWLRLFNSSGSCRRTNRHRLSGHQLPDSLLDGSALMPLTSDEGMLCDLLAVFNSTVNNNQISPYYCTLSERAVVPVPSDRDLLRDLLALHGTGSYSATLPYTRTRCASPGTTNIRPPLSILVAPGTTLEGSSCLDLCASSLA